MIVRATAPLTPSPYRGIESFRFIDQPIFFARDEEKWKLLRYVRVYRGVLLYGDSGSGKSSLINAGFIPAAIEEGFRPDRLRVQPRDGQEIIVERISVTADGQSPYLPSNFAADEDTSPRVVLSIDALEERLRQLPADRSPLLILDQFEEFVTLFEEAVRGTALKEALATQEKILNVLASLLREHTIPVKLLFVFREDYLAKLTKLFVRVPDLPDQYQRLTPPRTEALHEIIRGPFEKFPGHFVRELSPDLTKELEVVIEERSGTNTLNLSEVQIVCLRLWMSDDPDALLKSKGVQGLLEDYLNEALDLLGDELRLPAVALLSRMVTPSGTRNIVSEYDLITEGSQEEGIPENLMKSALEALVQNTKLVRRERRYNTFFYDIVSEFLVPWISKKKVERLAEIERRKLEEAELVRRQKLEEEERARRQKLYWLVGVSLMIALAIAVGAWLILRARTETVIQRDEVKRARAEEDKAKGERDTAVTDKINAETEATNLRETLAAVEGERDRANNTITQLNQHKADAERQRDELNARLQEVANPVKPPTDFAKIAELTSALAEKDKSYRNLLNQKTQAEQERDKYKREKEQAETERQNALSQNNDLKRQLDERKPTDTTSGTIRDEVKPVPAGTLVEVPNVLDLTRAEALQSLKRVGLGMELRSASAGTKCKRAECISSQDPKAGTKVRAGGKVQVKVELPRD